jgi:hypothetical protein
VGGADVHFFPLVLLQVLLGSFAAHSLL